MAPLRLARPHAGGLQEARGPPAPEEVRCWLAEIGRTVRLYSKRSYRVVGDAPNEQQIGGPHLSDPVHLLPARGELKHPDWQARY